MKFFQFFVLASAASILAMPIALSDLEKREVGECNGVNQCNGEGTSHISSPVSHGTVDDNSLESITVGGKYGNPNKHSETSNNGLISIGFGNSQGEDNSEGFKNTHSTGLGSINGGTEVTNDSNGVDKCNGNNQCNGE